MMRPPRPLVVGLVLVLVSVSAGLVPGCSSDPERPEAAPPPPEIPLPASALAGAVRALETLATRRPAGSLVQVRALECDSLFDRAASAEYVRVYLHLTVYGGSAEHARDAFELLRTVLAEHARAPGEDGPVSAERVRRSFGGLDWNPTGREDLVSYSDAVRLEVAPGRSARVMGASAPGSAPPTEPIESYIRTLARRPVGEVDLLLRASQPAAGVEELTCRIEEGQPQSRHTRADIGAFLAALEGGSPAVRVTRLEVERSQHEPDPHAERAWTFEAELTVRVPDADATLERVLAGSR